MMSEDAGLGSAEDEFTVGNDVALLATAWRNEKAAPELLPYKGDLVERIQEQVSLQEENIKEITQATPQEIATALYRWELSRVYFLLRSYLRTRVLKIELNALHIINTPELYERLSPKEIDFVGGYVELFEKHMSASVLSKCPERYNSLLQQSATSQEVDMIPQPDLNTFVFARAKQNIGALQVDDEGDETIDLLLDELYIIRYKPIKRLLENGQLELV